MALRERLAAVKANAASKTKVSGWALPRQSTSFADEGTWLVLLSRPASPVPCKGGWSSGRPSNRSLWIGQTSTAT
jgi:hypothetical protein